MALFRLASRKNATDADNSPTKRSAVIDVTSANVVQVGLSLHDTPGIDDQLGEALCMVSPGWQIVDATGAVVPIRRQPHRLDRNDFRALLKAAAVKGHLLDGFLEIEAAVDVVSGTICWEPENGPGLELPFLDEVVANTFASLIETSLFGPWFVPREFTRKSPLN